MSARPRALAFAVTLSLTGVAEVGYVFDNLAAESWLPRAAEDQQLADAMAEYWVEFAKTHSFYDVRKEVRGCTPGQLPGEGCL